MNRRDFIGLGAAGVLAASCGCTAAKAMPVKGASVSKREFHVFSKMFQPPTLADVDSFLELMAKAEADGIEWTVRPKGHIEPASAKTQLPRIVEKARKHGLKSTMMVTAITDGNDAQATDLLKIAADCGFTRFRPGYYFYGEKETFDESLDRIKAGFRSLEKVSEKTGLRCCYQNHSSWGPAIFGGLLWDLHEVLRDIDPKYVGIEYDPMHAVFETNPSWVHTVALLRDRIGAVCLKDFHYLLDDKNPKMHAKRLCRAGEGIVPWNKVNELLGQNDLSVPFIVHFEYDFDRKNLLQSVKRELDYFKGVFS